MAYCRVSAEACAPMAQLVSAMNTRTREDRVRFMTRPSLQQLARRDRPLLNPLAGRFGGEQIALGIERRLVHTVELSGVVAEVAERADHRAGGATNQAKLKVAEIGDG